MENQLTIYCGNALLADGARDGLTGICETLGLNGEVVVQNALYVNAAWAQFFSRGNGTNAFQFRICTAFDDAVDASAFLGQLRANIAEVIDLTISLSITGGKSVTHYAPNAKWDKFAAQQIGCSIIVTYQVTAGLILTTLDGGGGAPLQLPVVPDNVINPLIILAGVSANVNDGEDLFCRGALASGSITINSGGRAFALSS